jgi:hypothetical protein
MSQSEQLPQSRVSFCVRGHFDPNDFSKRVGLTPSQVFRSGDVVKISRNPTVQRRSIRKHDTDGWVFRSPYKKTWDVGDQLVELAKAVAPSARKIVSFCKEKSLTVVFKLDLTVFGGQTPAITVNPVASQIASSLNAPIEVDIICSD